MREPGMLFHRSYAPRNRRSSAQLARQVRPGLQPSSPRYHRGWTFQLVRRRLGVTVSRTLFGVIICDPDGLRVAYLDPFTSARLARGAAERWIDQAIRRREWVPGSAARRAIEGPHAGVPAAHARPRSVDRAGGAPPRPYRK